MSDYYTVEGIFETKFEQDEHGNTWYSVKFAGKADNALWLAKNRPDIGDKVYGHIERTKSGKGWRFKRDPEPEEGEDTEPVEKSLNESEQPMNPKQLMIAFHNLLQAMERIEKKLDFLINNKPDDEVYDLSGEKLDD